MQIKILRGGGGGLILPLSSIPPFLKMCHPHTEIDHLTFYQLIKIDNSSIDYLWENESILN